MTTKDLRVRLLSKPGSPALEVAIHNDDPDNTYSLLIWDSPLDPQAVKIGTLIFEDAETGATISTPTMKVNRLLPPPRDAVVEIAPKSTFSKDIVLTSPWIPEKEGLYRVRMQGTWKAVWAKPTAQVTDDELAAMANDEAKNEFRSNDAELQLE